MDTSKLTSDDILQQISQVTSALPEGTPDEEQESYGWSPEVAAPAPQYEEEPEEPVYDGDAMLADHFEQDHNLRSEWRASELERLKSEFLKTGVPPQAMDYESWKTYKEVAAPHENMQRALQLDLSELQLRYPRAYPQFARKMQLGQIDVPSDIEGEPNALEQLLIQSVMENARQLDTETLAEVIGHAEFEDERRPPLRTRSLDVAVPARVKPPKQPVRRQPKYSLPDLSQEEMREALNWAIQKKMRGGK